MFLLHIDLIWNTLNLRLTFSFERALSPFARRQFPSICVFTGSAAITPTAGHDDIVEMAEGVTPAQAAQGMWIKQ